MVQAGAGAVAVMVTVKGTPVRALPAAQPQPSRPPPAPHSDCLCAIGRVVAASGIHDTGLGLRAQLEPKVLDPPGICGEEQSIPARRAAARRRFFDRCAPPVTRSHHATPPLCSHKHFCHQLFRPGRSPWRPHVTPQTIGTIVVAFTRPSMASPSLSRPLRDHDSHGLSRASGRRQVAIPSHGAPLGAASVVWRAPAHAPHRLQ